MHTKVFGYISAISLATVSPALAEFAPTDPPMKMYSQCISEALDNGSVAKVGESIVFSCYDAAKPFFAFLGSRNRPAIDAHFPNTGAWRIRFVDITVNRVGEGNDACRQHVEEANGEATTGYRCDLYLSVGSFINE